MGAEGLCRVHTYSRMPRTHVWFVAVAAAERAECVDVTAAVGGPEKREYGGDGGECADLERSACRANGECSPAGGCPRYCWLSSRAEWDIRKAVAVLKRKD